MSKADPLREIMASEGEAIRDNTRRFNQGRYDSVAQLKDYEELKAEARSIKKKRHRRSPGPHRRA
jgi:L-lactate utilization protein LutB